MFTTKIEYSGVTIKVDEENKASTYSFTDDTIEAIKKVMFAVDIMNNEGNFQFWEEEYSMRKVIGMLGKILEKENARIKTDGIFYFI